MGTATGAPVRLTSQALGPLPIINAFCDRLGLTSLLTQHLPPDDDARVKLAPATAVGVVVRNLVAGRQPAYALARWAGRYDPALLGLAGEEAGLLNDDRVGRALARLFDADRASLLTRLVVDAIDRFQVDVSQLHNDSTSIKLTGAYADADGRTRRGKPTAAIARGHSKDFRPDLKQLVWILTVTADGGLPVIYRVADGNTTDHDTHIPTWNGLVALTGRVDFLYVADCKLATRANMSHIDSLGGRFLSVLPASRTEDRQFRDWIADSDHDPVWTEAARRPGRRHGDPDQVWHTIPAPHPSAEDYRIVWIRSSAKIDHDAAARRDRITRGVAALDDLNQRLTSPKTRLKTIAAVEQAAHRALERIGATRWVSFTVTEQVTERTREEQGRRYTHRRRITRTRHHLHVTVDEDQLAHDAASDGCFPLISNDRDLSDAELLTAYKWQPHLEKRHTQLKSIQLVAPMFLRHPARIEGLLCCQFIAMLIQALLERQIRQAMRRRGLTHLSIYPEDRGCPAPTAARILEIFTDLARHHLQDQHGNHLQIFPPQLTELQAQVLDLLDLPHDIYTG